MYRAVFRRAILTFVLCLPGRSGWAQDAVPSQGWTRGEREIFANSPVGSRLLPFAWFGALEAAGSEELVSAPERLARFGLLPSTPNGANPGGLPVGLSRERDRTDGLWLGMSCAACHVRGVSAEGQVTVVEGAGSLFDAGRFLRALRDALVETERDPARFERFAARLSVPDGERAALRARLVAVAARPQLAGGDAGPGRFDVQAALAGLAGEPAVPAPVRVPRLWGAFRLRQTLANGSGSGLGHGPLLRNVGQVLATGGTAEPSPDGSVTSSVSLPDLLKIEALLRRLDAPGWPAGFPPIDPALAERGGAVFAQSCASCHAPPASGADGLVAVPVVEVGAVGTDGAAARVPPAGMALAAGAARVPLPAGAGPGRPGYRALPLAGIWASAPFLHNGSVPNLVQLLTPPGQRVQRFGLSGRNYDPVAVGLPSEANGEPMFETSAPGNGNGGHAYGTDLPDADKRALVEFLKTL